MIHRRRTAILSLAFGTFVAAGPLVAAQPKTGSGLGAAVREARERTKTYPADDAFWKQISPGADGLLTRSEAALASGRPSIALLTFVYAFDNVNAFDYVRSQPEARTDLARLEALWAAAGRDLGPEWRANALRRVEKLRPALLRALAEGAVVKAGVFLGSSLEYGRNTTPESGLFYLGLARAQAAFVDLAVRLDAGASAPADPPRTRSLQARLDALDGDLISIYRPPLSIDRHPDFIAAGGSLKEARELDDARLWSGSLLRYTQAQQRLAGLRDPAPAPEAAAARASALREDASSVRRELGAMRGDHSIAEAFLERAEGELSSGKPEPAAIQTAAMSLAAVRRYVEAMRSEPSPRAAVHPRVTVTLVRWPYT